MKKYPLEKPRVRFDVETAKNFKEKFEKKYKVKNYTISTEGRGGFSCYDSIFDHNPRINQISCYFRNGNSEIHRFNIKKQKDKNLLLEFNILGRGEIESNLINIIENFFNPN